MHSSRMRTVRNSSHLLGGGLLPWGAVPAPGGAVCSGRVCLVLGGVSAPGRVPAAGGVPALGGGGAAPGGGIPACTEVDVADGNNII